MKKTFIVKSTEIQLDEKIDYFLRNNFILKGEPSEAEFILVLGGDGTMFKAIRNYRNYQLPFCGLNYGHVGFLMNQSNIMTLEEVLSNRVETVSVHMLQAKLFNKNGEIIGNELAFNDFYFERTGIQTSKINISVNGKIRFNPLICDGVIVATSAGSTAYNASSGGVILPIGTNNMVLTGICPATFYRWKSVQLSEESSVILEPVEVENRPVRFLSDGIKIDGVYKAEINVSNQIINIIFALSQDFREKVLNLQLDGSYGEKYI